MERYGKKLIQTWLPPHGRTITRPSCPPSWRRCLSIGDFARERAEMAPLTSRWPAIRRSAMSASGPKRTNHRGPKSTFVRCYPAGSTGRCNTGVKSLCRGFELQGLTWSFIELTRHFVQIGLRVHRQVSSLRKVLSQQTIGVLVGTALPRTLRIAEVNVDIGRQRKSSLILRRLAPFPGQRLIQLTRQHFLLLDERGNNRLGVLIGHLR